MINPEDEALACAILAMAKSLNLKVLAEGVEDFFVGTLLYRSTYMQSKQLCCYHIPFIIIIVGKIAGIPYIGKWVTSD